MFTCALELFRHHDDVIVCSFLNVLVLKEYFKRHFKRHYYLKFISGYLFLIRSCCDFSSKHFIYLFQRSLRTEACRCFPNVLIMFFLFSIVVVVTFNTDGYWVIS